MKENTSCIAIFTGQSPKQLLGNGQTIPLTIGEKTKNVKYVVFIQNQNDKKRDFIYPLEPHGLPFLVVKLDEILPVGKLKIIKFSEYCSFRSTDRLPPLIVTGWKNPVRYGKLEDFGLSSRLFFTSLKYLKNEIPLDPCDDTTPKVKSDKIEKPVSIPEAKLALAKTLGIDPKCIEIIIKV